VSAPTAPSGGAAERAITQTLVFIAELRELPVLKPVVGVQLSREQMVTHVRRTLKEEVPPEVVKATNDFLFLAGIVPADFDYEQSLLTVLGSELAGFYDPKEQRMYLGTDLGVEEQRATLVHELVHALQDQHYGLAELTRWRIDMADRMSALHCLAEGDATSAMLDALMVGSGRTALDLPEQLLISQIEQMQQADPKVPAIVKRSVVAPYVDGLKFVHALRERGGFEQVDAVWKNPPSSTEQVLHPAKYFAREEPVSVPLPVASPSGPQTLLYRDVEGEQALRLLFEEWLPQAEAAASASDWAGDRLAVFADGQTTSFAWRIRFDSELAGLRAFHAVELWVKGNQIKGQGGGVMVCRERSERGPVAASLQADEVLVVAGPADRRAGSHQTATCTDAVAWLKRLRSR
jgi:hypothetical protein